jgi:mannosylglucosylglycerate synthase
MEKVAILHYTSPPVIGGVEVVIQAHAHLFTQNGYSVTIISGRGSRDGLPDGVDYIQVPLMDSQHPDITKINSSLETGSVPENFIPIKERLVENLKPLVGSFDRIIIHNILTKHFNLALTAALLELLDEQVAKNCIAWCHDISWTSPHSMGKIFSGYPWDLIRTPQNAIEYVAISEQRKEELLGLFVNHPVHVRVIYNGVDPYRILGISTEMKSLLDTYSLWQANPLILMPVRITQAKNIELALHVTEKLKDYSDNPQLIVTGPPDPHDPGSYQYFEQLTQMRSRLGLEKNASFLFENTNDPQAPFILSINQVFELLRVADLVFMPSHREGFGLPILEAGLVGIPIVSTAIPVSVELAKNNLLIIPDQGDPGQITEQMVQWLEKIPTYRLKNRVKHELTWQSIFDTSIAPLLENIG